MRLNRLLDLNFLSDEMMKKYIGIPDLVSRTEKNAVVLSIIQSQIVDLEIEMMSLKIILVQDLFQVITKVYWMDYVDSDYFHKHESVFVMVIPSIKNLDIQYLRHTVKTLEGTNINQLLQIWIEYNNQGKIDSLIRRRQREINYAK